MKKVTLIQTVIPNYREKFIQYIKNKLGESLDVFAGEFYFEPTVHSTNNINSWGLIKNVYILL